MAVMDKGKMPDSVIVYSRRVCEAEQRYCEESLKVSLAIPS